MNTYGIVSFNERGTLYRWHDCTYARENVLESAMLSQAGMQRRGRGVYICRFASVLKIQIAFESLPIARRCRYSSKFHDVWFSAGPHHPTLPCCKYSWIFQQLPSCTQVGENIQTLVDTFYTHVYVIRGIRNILNIHQHRNESKLS